MFHGIVEKTLRRVKNIFDFNDFVTMVQISSGDPKVILMETEDLSSWDERATNGQKVPHLINIQVINFERHSKLLYYKGSHED